MASDINHVVIVGRLTRDAELRYANSGTAICRFSLANNYSRKQGDQWTEETNFFDCTLFGRRGEAVHKYLTKGKQVGVDGSLRFSKWEQDGQPRSKVEIHVVELQLFGSRDGGREQGSEYSSSRQTEQSGPGEYGSGSEFEDDVPF
jgi:single-strand DNA-binding protein